MALRAVREFWFAGSRDRAARAGTINSGSSPGDVDRTKSELPARYRADFHDCDSLESAADHWPRVSMPSAKPENDSLSDIRIWVFGTALDRFPAGAAPLGG